MDQSIRVLDVMNYLLNKGASYGSDSLEVRARAKMDIVTRVLRDEIDNMLLVNGGGGDFNREQIELLKSLWVVYNFIMDCNE